MQFEPERFIDVGPSQIAYRRVGSGPDVVFLHGWPLHSATFRGLLPRMADRYTCHLFDLPGAGSTRVSEATRFELRAHAEAMRRAVAAVGVESYALLAHDSGGAVARFMAAEEPSRVRGLVLGNTEIPGFRSPLLRALMGSGKTRLGQAGLALAMSSRLYRRSFLGFGACFEDRSLIDGEFHELFVEPMLRSREVVQRQMRLVASFEWSHLDDLGRAQRDITAPVLLIWGADDPYFPLEPARRMQKELGWEIEVLRPGKLFVHEERPDDFARLSAQFFDRCFRDPPAPPS
jgi:pimeloyl-ACP methyl ester carboxylesterase